MNFAQVYLKAVEAVFIEIADPTKAQNNIFIDVQKTIKNWEEWILAQYNQVEGKSNFKVCFAYFK